MALCKGTIFCAYCWARLTKEELETMPLPCCKECLEEIKKRTLEKNSLAIKE